MAAPLPGIADLTDFTLEPVRDVIGLYPPDVAINVDIRFFVLDTGPHGVVLPRTLPPRRSTGHPDTPILASVDTSDYETTANLLARARKAGNRRLCTGDPRGPGLAPRYPLGDTA
ncbi:hypothetical protein [Arthrobacter rhombi]|uniref:hypothetical protein n=1 Tax=Arthrobacter rhombi TaxID=71253 RepID=UPI0031E3FD84